MELQILLSNHKAKYKQIYEQIRKAALEKKLPAHARLPSKRHMKNLMLIKSLMFQESTSALLQNLWKKGFIHLI